MTISKLGIACLIIASVLIAFINFRVLLILGFLYYAYKFLYKKEEVKRFDKIIVIILVVLLIAELLLEVYFVNTFMNMPYYTNSTV